ncbi:tetratricopeptide repeat protein [Flavobacterium cyanobacteriorum]|nr:hypothetical protein [Flavobacterium cyanobacteriorum]
MKLKQVIAALMLVIAAQHAFAQDDKTCGEKLKSLEEQWVQRLHAEAALTLQGLAESCPKYSERIYIKGAEVLNFAVESALNPEERQKAIDKLFTLYAQYDKNFPNNQNASDIKKAMLLSQYKLVNDDELYAMLNASFAKNSTAFTDYNALETYFMLYLKRYEAGDKGITNDQFIEKYGAISGQAALAQYNFMLEKDALVAKQENLMLTDDEKARLAFSSTSAESLDAVIDNINILASKHLTCQKLEEYFEKSFEKGKAEVLWLRSVVEVMFRNRCNASQLLAKALTALHGLKPTAQTAYYMGTLSQRKDKRAEAAEFFNLSAKLETSVEKKAERYFAIAGLMRPTDKKQAREYALKAAQLNPKFGRPYLFLAEMYAAGSPECNLTDFEAKALNWLAIETLKKAETAEPKYKATVAAMAQRYAKNAPTKEDMKAAKVKKGNKINYGCWINETIIAPNL